MRVEEKNEIREKAAEVEREIERERREAADEEVKSLRARLSLSQGAQGADPSTPPASSASSKAKEDSDVRPSSEGLRDALSPAEESAIRERIRSDTGYAESLSRILTEEDEVTPEKPEWYKPLGIFGARLDLGGGNIVELQATSFGSKAGDLQRQGGMLELQQRLQEVQRKLQEFEDKTDDVSVAKAGSIIKDQDKIISRLIKLQAIAALSPSVKKWEGHVFCDKTGVPFPLLSGLRMDHEEEVSQALTIIDAIPEKAVTMIRKGSELLAVEGLENKWRRGNSRGR